jgi:hypothetical protein
MHVVFVPFEDMWTVASRTGSSEAVTSFVEQDDFTCLVGNLVTRFQYSIVCASVYFAVVFQNAKPFECMGEHGSELKRFDVAQCETFGAPMTV